MDINKFIYKIFNIEDAEFFNINIEKDIAKFIKPYTVELLTHPTAKKCNATIIDFFETVRKELKSGNTEKGISLFSDNLKEPKENCLGYADKTTNGKGLRELAKYAMHQILDNHLLDEITHLSDLQLYVEQIMYDRVSDIYTNVVRNVLNDYTLEQTRKYGMEKYIHKHSFGPYWDIVNHKWVVDEKKDMLVIDGKPILLIPEKFLQGSYNANTMYRNLVVKELIDDDLLKNVSPLIRTRKNGQQYIFKKEKIKDLKKLNFLPTKAEMINYAIEHNGATKRLRQILAENRYKRLMRKQSKNKNK